MEELFAYHAVTEKPMYIGQHIVFDKNHHNGVWQRVNCKQDIVSDIYNNPEKYKDVKFEHHTSVALRELPWKKYELITTRIIRQEWLACMFQKHWMKQKVVRLFSQFRQTDISNRKTKG